MESYGEILQKTREEKNLDIDKIAREISIEKRFLVGLENEDYSAFPGEAYMVGFLRNYSNYLELDTNFILKLYNNKKIQEAPVPVELLAKRKSPFLLP
ncbi:MAG: helix-turn-helix domain-containing protein, partial [Clostridia bacterium]|nr:helix-turn-helix domain-containing protein [Clostridia bacterium]